MVTNHSPQANQTISSPQRSINVQLKPALERLLPTNHSNNARRGAWSTDLGRANSTLKSLSYQSMLEQPSLHSTKSTPSSDTASSRCPKSSIILVHFAGGWPYCCDTGLLCTVCDACHTKTVRSKPVSQHLPSSDLRSPDLSRRFQHLHVDNQKL
ncbi:hypothetical protein ACOSQ3_021947 [Xanthoceras sorbifolium]